MPEASANTSPPLKPATPFRVFISYARRDSEHLESLRTHLANLTRQGWIETWSDRNLYAGDTWEKELLQKLRSAEIVLLLVSADFHASNYIHDEELPEIIKRHQQDAIRVVPIVVRPAESKGSYPDSFQCLPLDEDRNLRPITSWDDRDQAWVSVVKELRLVLERLQEQRRGWRHWHYRRLTRYFRHWKQAMALIVVGLLARGALVNGRPEKAPFSVEIWALAMSLDSDELVPVVPGDVVRGPGRLTLGVKGNQPMCFGLYLPTEQGGLVAVYPLPPAKTHCLETTARFVLPPTACCVIDGSADEIQAVLIAAPTQSQLDVAVERLERPGAVDWSEKWRETAVESGPSGNEVGWTGAAGGVLREGQVMKVWKARSVEATEAVYYKLDLGVRVSEEK